MTTFYSAIHFEQNINALVVTNMEVAFSNWEISRFPFYENLFDIYCEVLAICLGKRIAQWLYDKDLMILRKLFHIPFKKSACLDKSNTGALTMV